VRYVIGCDVGSQGTNAALHREDGTLVASRYEPHDLSFPHPGWAEQDATDWPKAVTAAVGALVGEVDRPSDIVGLSFGSQLDGMVACDGAGRPLRPAMIWMDRRAEAQAAALAERISPEEFYELSGTNLDSSHAVFKALWIRDEEPDVFRDARRFMPPGTFVLHEVAGAWAVDYSNASSLALLDPRTRRWSERLLETTGIEPERLKGRFHVHVPAGAVPKDGPSAGVTMVTALASLLADQPVRSTVGMTGEVTLQGRVLPIGGVKQKVLAAHRAGITEVILPKRNEGDLDDVPEKVREEITFHPVETVDEALALALEPAAEEPRAAVA